MVAMAFTPVLAAVNEIVWKKFFAWESIDLPIAVDENGNVIVVRSPLVDPPIITKLSGGGKVLWNRQIGVSEHEPSDKDSANDVAVDSNGFIYVVGQKYGIEPDPKAFISKYGPRGGHHWTKRIEEARFERVDVGPGGNIYVVGTTDGELPNVPRSSGKWPNPFIRKYNPSGKIFWTRPISFSGFTDFTEAFDVAVGPGGGVYVVGNDGSNSGPDYNQDLFLRKYSPRGGTYWTRGIRRNEWYFAFDAKVVVDRRGEVTILAEAVSDTGAEALAVKYTHKGKRVWTRVSAGVYPTSLAVDNDRSVYVIGWSFTGPKASARKYSADGNRMWTRDFANGFSSLAAADSANNLYVTGIALKKDSVRPFLVKFRQ